MTVTTPSKGMPLRASWGADVANAINALAGMAPAGMLVRTGVTGCGVQPLPENRRVRDTATHFWVANISVDEDSDEAEGEWVNCRFQYGYDPSRGDSDVTGRDTVEDGQYYLEVDMGNDTFELKHVSIGTSVPGHDLENNIVRVPVGTIEDHEQTMCIDMVPIIYKYV